MSDAAAVMAPRPRIRPVTLGPQDVTVDHRSDGAMLLRSPQPLGRYPDKLTERLEFWAAETPGQVFLAQRDANGDWRTVTYEQALEFARRIGEALLARNLSAERPLVILSGNDIEHALLALGALYAGIPHAPISPAYSLMSGDFGKLRAILKLLTPGLVFAADGAGLRARHRRRGAGRCRIGASRVTRRTTAAPRALPISMRRRRARASPPRMTRSAPTPSPSSCSPRARPACRNA